MTGIAVDVQYVAQCKSCILLSIIVGHLGLESKSPFIRAMEMALRVCVCVCV